MPRRFIPAEEPDPAAPGELPPAGATASLSLGDGDSEPLATSAMLMRAKRRWEAQGVPTSIRMAPPDRDFNDMARVA